MEKIKTINSKLILSPRYLNKWQIGGMITPVPVVFKKFVRVYTGFRDKYGISRIGYIDLDKNNPYKILKVSKKPIIEIGENGAFDDNGMILGDIIFYNNYFYMFYVGFQIPYKNKFLAFTGLAKSKLGNKFYRVKKTPILDRNKDGVFFRAIHSVEKIKNKFHFYVGEGSKFLKINNKLYPSYDSKYFQFKNFDFPSDIKTIKIINRKKNEYRLGRPSVFNFKGKKHLFFTYGKLNLKYSYGYAMYNNGKFIRKDKNFLISKSNSNKDKDMICYPRFFSTNKNYIIYSGNNMGETGIFLSQIK